MEISDLIATAGTWLQGTGPENDVVISTRIRLARNLAGMPFLIKMDDGHQAETEETLTDAIAKADLPHTLTYFSMPDIGPLDRSLMVERHLISPELARQQGHCGVALARDETISIMVNEEDHVRIQVIRAGLSLEAAFEEATRVDDRLEEHLDYAFSARYGYLTACPTNVGTALRASVMLHLPALVLTRQIDKVFQAVTKMRLAVRGLHGEGTQASGDFY
ncbi:MAG: ATP--guanido phosphotransferase, partial [Phycisphaerae bacterium]|nr:ATP--guanido phosphotransferase [Phycisphaerae bacterium]